MTFWHYTKRIAHDKLKSKLSSVVDFTFKGGDKTFIRYSNDGAAYCGVKTKRGLGLKTAINHLIKNCYFNIGIVNKNR